jgi:hypothetical protein
VDLSCRHCHAGFGDRETKVAPPCAYLFLIALAGVALNAFVRWWWADPVAALAMTPIILREGFEGICAKPRIADACC